MRHTNLLILLSLCVIPACSSALKGTTGNTNKQTPAHSAAPTCSDAGCPLKYEDTETEQSEKLFEPVKQVSECPDGMVEVEGDYCPNVQEICLYNVDVDGNRINKPVSDLWSCGEYKYPTRCLSPQKDIKHLHFCMDKFEYPNKEGQLPKDWMNWFEAKKACESEGKRLCTANEWTLAAEGPEHHPLPYGDGYHRDHSKCNFDNHMPKGINVFNAKHSYDDTAKWLRSFLVPANSTSKCKSDYLIYNMSGNIDEWVVNEGGSLHHYPYISGLKGGHIWTVRNASRPMTDAHSPNFSWYESGTRCCSNTH